MKFFAAVAFLLLPWALLAQTPALVPLTWEKTPYPGGVPLKGMGDIGKWKISYGYPDDKPAVPGATPAIPSDGATFNDFTPPRVVEVARTKPWWNATLVNIKGERVEYWGNSVYRVALTPQSSEPVLMTTGVEYVNKTPDFSQKDFPDLEWISEKNFAGSGKLETLSCLVFTQGDGEDKTIVWINAETRRPVRWQKKGASRDFTYSDPPATDLKPPGNIMSVFEKMQVSWDRMTKRNPK